MNRALFAGLSSTVAQQVRMDVSANNLANVNTVGFKAARTTFMDAFYQTLRSGRPSQQGMGGMSPSQVGAGVSVGAITLLYSQGALQRTGQPLDAAIDGAGYFVVNGPQGIAFTRDGSFELDESNTLVMSSTGLKVQGWAAQEINGEATATGPLGDIVIPVGAMRAAKATTAVTMQGNLASEAPEGTQVTASVQVYDSLGAQHKLVLTFEKTATPLQWSVTAELEGTTTSPATITFKEDGTFDSISPDPFEVQTTGALPNGAAQLTVSIDFSAMTQFVTGAGPTARDQDGYGPAGLVGVSIDDGGVIQGTYSDGRMAPLAIIAHAVFPNEAGLDRVGNNIFRVSSASGMAQIAQSGQSGRGQIVGRALEMSNTDLTGSFLDMLITQRAYQAGARIISTANNLLEEAIQIANR